jgi:hypothetical protein
LWRQYFQYGYWKVRVMQKHPSQMRLRQFVLSALVTILAGSARGTRLSVPGTALLTLTLGAYAVATLASALTIAWRHGWCHSRLPLAFVIQHVSYGFGFRVGLARFMGSWKDRPRYKVE